MIFAVSFLTGCGGSDSPSGAAEKTSFTVTYDGNGETGGTVPAPQIKTLGVELVLDSNTADSADSTDSALYKTDFFFAGWNTAADGSGTDYAPGAIYTEDKDLVLFAKWTSLPVFTVTYDGNGATGGTAPVAQIKKFGENLVLDTNPVNLVRVGSTFIGWNTLADGTGNDYAVGATYSTDSSVTLFAKWTSVPTFAVTYDGNGATGGTAPAAQTKITDVDLILAANSGNLTKDSCAFIGWNTSADGTGTGYPSGVVYSANAELTLFAQWKKLQVYTVTYIANGETGGTVPAVQSKFENGFVNVSGNVGVLVKTGYNFAGWNTAADGSGVSYSEGAGYTANANVILYALWTQRAVYKVTYNANGAAGNVPVAQTKIDSVPLTLALKGNLDKAGFTFGGWNTLADGTGATYLAGAQYTENASTTLYAKWDLVPIYTVTYDANGATAGTAPAAQSKKHDSPLMLENVGNMAKAGSVFAGWNTLADGKGTAYASGAKYEVNASVNLFAQWKVIDTTVVPVLYTVSYDKNGASGVAPVFQTKTPGIPLKLAASDKNMSMEGFTFVGWNTAANGTGDAYKDSVTYQADSSVVLYAQWKEILKFSVTYNINGATGGTAPAAQSKAEKDSISIADNTGNLVKTGFTFEGWNIDSLGTGVTYTAGTIYKKDSALVLFAMWKPVVLTVTFGNGGASGTVPAKQEINYGGSLALPGIADLTKEGYAFVGWCTDSLGKADSVYAVEENYTVTANVTMFALWGLSRSTVSYSLNGAAGDAPAAQEVNFGDSIVLSNVGTAAKVGHTFAGWRSDSTGTGTLYVSGTKYRVTGSVTLYAQWTPVIYTVTYAANGGVGTVASQQRAYNDTLTLAGSDGLTLAGHTFAGWKSSVKDTVYKAGTVYTVTGEVTMTAQWTKDSYTITYNANGATSGTAPIVAAKGYNDTLILLGASGLIKTGHDFAGWKPSVPEKDTVYKAGEVYTVTGAVTMYAQWTPVIYTVTYAANGGVGTVASQQRAYNDTLTLAGSDGLTLTGYTFAGWKSSVKDTVYKAGTVYTVTGEVTMTAQWELNTYTVTYVNVKESSTVKRTYNDTLTLSTPTPRMGFTFTGWKDGSGTVHNGGTVYTVTGDVTMTAQWSGFKSKFVYNENDGTTSPATHELADSVSNGDSLVLIAVESFAKANHTFAGWCTKQEPAEGDSIYKVGDKFPIYNVKGKIITMYAQWDLNTYRVILDGDGGKFVIKNKEMDSVVSRIEHGEDVTLPDVGEIFKARTGHNLVGWKTSDKLAKTLKPNTKVTIEQGVTFTAQWEKIKYTVTYKATDATGGTVPTAETVEYGTKIQLAAAGTLVKTGRTFGGWLADSTGNTYVAGADYTVTGDVTMYAKWNLNTYRVILNANGGKFVIPDLDGSGKGGIGGKEQSRDSLILSIGHGKSVTLPNVGSYLEDKIEINFVAPSTHQRLVGWRVKIQSGSRDLEPGRKYTITDDATFTAVWQGIDYTVSYDANGGTGTVASQTGNYNEEITLSDGSGLSNVGYDFAGWSTVANEIGTVYSGGASYTVAGTATLYAVWRKKIIRP